MINFAVGKFIKTIGIMRNKFKKGDNVKIRRDQTGGVWQVKEVKERECDKGHPETRFIYLCEEVDSKHQQWIKEERLDKCRSGIQLLIDEIESNQDYFHKLLDVKFTYSGGTNGMCAGALAELERASRKRWHVTSTNEIKVEDEPEFKVGDWVRVVSLDNSNSVLSMQYLIGCPICIKRFVLGDCEMTPDKVTGISWSLSPKDLIPYEPKDDEFYWVEGNQLGAYVVCGGYYSNIIIDGCAKDLDERGFANKLHTRRPATPTEKDKLIKAVEEEYGKTYNEETKQWEDMAVEWTPQPFERVLYNYDGIGWRGDFYSHKEDKDVHLVGAMYIDDVDDAFTLIPYKGNEALLGTTDECKTKYKIK